MNRRTTMSVDDYVNGVLANLSGRQTSRSAAGSRLCEEVALTKQLVEIDVSISVEKVNFLSKPSNPRLPVVSTLDAALPHKPYVVW